MRATTQNKKWRVVRWLMVPPQWKLNIRAFKKSAGRSQASGEKREGGGGWRAIVCRWYEKEGLCFCGTALCFLFGGALGWVGEGVRAGSSFPFCLRKKMLFGITAQRFTSFLSCVPSQPEHAANYISIETSTVARFFFPSFLFSAESKWTQKENKKRQKKENKERKQRKKTKKKRGTATILSKQWIASLAGREQCETAIRYQHS